MWATITKYRKLGGLNNRHLFLTVLDAVKFKIKVQADLVPDENSLHGLQMAMIHHIFTWQRERGEGGEGEREKRVLPVPSHKGTH